MSFMEVTSAAFLVPIARLSVCLKLYSVYVQYSTVISKSKTKLKCSAFDK